MTDAPSKSTGLENIVAGETELCSLDGTLRYCGYAIEDLVRESSFVEVAYLLWHGDLPDSEQLADFQSSIVDAGSVEPLVLDVFQNIPLHVPAMDVLRTGLSLLAHFEPLPFADTPEGHVEQSLRLLAKIPALIAARERVRRGAPLLEPRPDLGFAGNFLYEIHGREPEADEEEALDVALMLYAEHEFNASTFATRVVASTLSDIYSAVIAGLGALKGPLHGGANERALQLFRLCETPEQATAWIQRTLAQHQRVMGFGHRVYKDGDPRADLLRPYCRALADSVGCERWEAVADAVETVMLEEKGLRPNLDWPAARLFFYLGFAEDLYPPLFVASRISGWCAHYWEQWTHNRLIRPRANYIGVPARKYPSLRSRE